MIDWRWSYLRDVSYFVEIDGVSSDCWSHDVGCGQGRVLSSDFFNLISLSQALWIQESSVCSAFYVDDGVDLISADNLQDLNNLIKSTASQRGEWYTVAGLTMNESKTVIMGMGCTPDSMTINGVTISPSTSLKFLGVTLQNNLKFDKHIQVLCNKIRYAAGRIRVEGSSFSMNDRRILYNSWINGLIFSNCLTFLPHINNLQLSKLQTAMNRGIRAVSSLPNRGYAPVDDLRRHLNLPSIIEIRDKALYTEAWKRRKSFLEVSIGGPRTRARSCGNLPLGKSNGILTHLLSNKLIVAWNQLPLHLKHDDSRYSARRKIRNLVLQNASPF